MALFDNSTGGSGLFGGGIGGQAAGYATPEQMRLAYINALKRRDQEPTRPILHWSQGVGNVLEKALAGYELGQINKRQEEQARAGAEALVPSLGGGLPTGGSPMAALPESPAGDATSPVAPMASTPPSSGVLSPDYISRTAQIESGGNPNAVTGSNRGLMQFGPQEERQFGINDQNRTDPNAQASALTREAALHTKVFEKQLGRTPTPGELYLMHQQGIAGGPALLNNPDIPAWQAIRPYYKSDAMAKLAISGNTYKDAPFYGADPNSVRAADFSNYWKTKFERGLANVGGTRTASLGTSVTDAMPGGNAFAPTSGAGAGELSPVTATINALGGGAPPAEPQAPPMVRVAEAPGATRSDAKPLKDVPAVNYAQPQVGRFVPDSMFPVRPRITEQEARAVQVNPAIPPQAKALHLQQYYAQAQPQEVKIAGGTISRDPRTGIQTWNPELKEAVKKVAGIEVKEFWTLGPDGKRHVIQTEGPPAAATAQAAATPVAAPPSAPAATAAPTGAAPVAGAPNAQDAAAMPSAISAAPPQAPLAPIDMSSPESMAAAAIDIKGQEAEAEARGKNRAALAQQSVEQAQTGPKVTGALERLGGFPEEFGKIALERAIGPWAANLNEQERAGIMGSGLSVNVAGQAIPHLVGELSTLFTGGASPTEVRDRIDTTTKNLAAVMKPFIRKPGEGAWSDKDQANLEAQLGQLTRARSVEEYGRRLNDIRENVSRVFQIPVAEPKPQARSANAPETAEQSLAKMPEWQQMLLAPETYWGTRSPDPNAPRVPLRERISPKSSFNERFLTPPAPAISTQEAFIRALGRRGGT